MKYNCNISACVGLIARIVFSELPKFRLCNRSSCCQIRNPATQSSKMEL